MPGPRLKTQHNVKSPGQRDQLWIVVAGLLDLLREDGTPPSIIFRKLRGRISLCGANLWTQQPGSPAWWTARPPPPSLGFKAHPHMLRHACGYALANKGHARALQAYLGHRNIQHTVRYTELSPMRYKDFWRE
jgi:integrase